MVHEPKVAHCFSKESFTDTATPICLYVVYGEWSMVVSVLQLGNRVTNSG